MKHACQYRADAEKLHTILQPLRLWKKELLHLWTQKHLFTSKIDAYTLITDREECGTILERAK